MQGEGEDRFRDIVTGKNRDLRKTLKALGVLECPEGDFFGGGGTQAGTAIYNKIWETALAAYQRGQEDQKAKQGKLEGQNGHDA